MRYDRDLTFIILLHIQVILSISRETAPTDDKLTFVQAMTCWRRQQIIKAKAGPDPSRHIALLGHNELTRHTPWMSMVWYGMLLLIKVIQMSSGKPHIIL